VFDNAGEPTRLRFAGLPLVFDPGTIRHIEERGVGPGWRCLEVGAGGGTIARWLAERVGPTGFVLATDIDTRFLNDLRAPNLEVRRHDVGTEPLPEAAFDLVHCRLVLVHVPQREAALARLAAALQPGGWLVVEEFGPAAWDPGLALDPVTSTPRAYELLLEVMRARGVRRGSRGYGPSLPARMQALGLTEIGAEGRIFSWTGGSPGAWVIRSGIEQLREAILATGRISDDEVAADLARLDDPAFAFTSPLLWAVWGRRAVASS
jgi:SAM-dependent methyltransferase